MFRLVERAKQELPKHEMAALILEALASPNPKIVSKRIAEDFRAGRTVAIGRVTLSRYEITKFINATAAANVSN